MPNAKLSESHALNAVDEQAGRAGSPSLGSGEMTRSSADDDAASVLTEVEPPAAEEDAKSAAACALRARRTRAHVPTVTGGAADGRSAEASVLDAAAADDCVDAVP